MPAIDKEAWLLVGDLNEIVDLNEKYSPFKGSSTRCERFDHFIKNLSLIDFGFHSDKFT